MPGRANWSKKYGKQVVDPQAIYPQPPYLPSIGLMPSPHTNLKTLMGYPGSVDNVQVRSRYYSDDEISQVAYQTGDYEEYTSLTKDVAYVSAHPGTLKRLSATAMGLVAVGGATILLGMMGML